MPACKSREEEDLKQLEELEEIDVTELAEDEIVKIFEEKAHKDKVLHYLLRAKLELMKSKVLCNSIKIEKLSSPTEVLVQTTNQEITAIVVRLNSGDGAVRFFRKDKDLGAREMRPGATDRATMVILGLVHSFWLIGNVSIRYITHS